MGYERRVGHLIAGRNPSKQCKMAPYKCLALIFSSRSYLAGLIWELEWPFIVG